MALSNAVEHGEGRRARSEACSRSPRRHSSHGVHTPLVKEGGGPFRSVSGLQEMNQPMNPSFSTPRDQLLPTHSPSSSGLQRALSERQGQAPKQTGRALALPEPQPQLPADPAPAAGPSTPGRTWSIPGGLPWSSTWMEPPLVLILSLSLVGKTPPGGQGPLPLLFPSRLN